VLRLGLAALAAATTLYLLHRLALLLEARGHLYYLHRKPSRSALGNAFLEVQGLLEPGKRLVVEERTRVEEEEAEPGEPPDAGSAAAERPVSPAK
jgi:hypothetical protein